MSALRGCPFCGGDASIISTRAGSVARSISVGCDNCGCSTPVFDLATTLRSEAIAAWNRRHVPAGFAVVPDRGDAVWFLNAADPEYGHNNLCEMLDDQCEDLVEVHHATVVRRTWHVRLDDDENGQEWRGCATEPEARAMLAAAKEPK